MNISQLTLAPDQLLLAAGAAGFVVGAILMWLLRRSSSASDQEDPRNHKIRALDADLRTARRQLDDLEQKLVQKTAEITESVATLQELRSTLAVRDKRIDELEKDLHGSIEKTNELRLELQERSIERVREQVRAEAAVTELEVERAGSEAVMTEIARLKKEREELTATMQKLGGSLFLDDDLFGSER